MHITLSPTQQVALLHEENQPGTLTTTITSPQGDPFEMVLVDGPTFLDLGDDKIDFQKAKGAISATVASEGEAWYLIARADKPTEIDVETTFTPLAQKVKPQNTPVAGPIMATTTTPTAAPAPAAAPINWMLIAAIAVIVLLIGYVLYTQFFAPKTGANSRLRTL